MGIILSTATLPQTGTELYNMEGKLQSITLSKSEAKNGRLWCCLGRHSQSPRTRRRLYHQGKLVIEAFTARKRQLTMTTDNDA